MWICFLLSLTIFYLEIKFDKVSTIMLRAFTQYGHSIWTQANRSIRIDIKYTNHHQFEGVIVIFEHCLAS